MGSSLSGMGPIGFTWTVEGEQLSIPLSAFELDGSTVSLSSAWSSVLSGTDATVLCAIAQGRYATGQLSTAVQPPPAPALTFAAAAPGPEGNAVGVAITVVPPGSGTPNVLNTDLQLEVTETDTYSGLAGASAALAAIGSDHQPAVPTDPPYGTGLVQFSSAGPSGAGLPQTGQPDITISDTNPHAVLAEDGVSTLFEVVARPGFTGSPSIKVSLDVGTETFSLTASYDSGLSSALSFEDLTTSLPAGVGFLVSVQPPPGGGFAVPTGYPMSAPIQLTGGSLGMPARGVAYTSSS